MFMNKKVLTLCAGFLLAGSLLMPSDAFAQLQYADATYENVPVTSVPTKTGTKNARSCYWVFQYKGKDYIATVEGNKLVKKRLLEATPDDAITVTLNTKASGSTPASYTIASTNGTLGNVGSSPYTDFGIATSMSQVTFGKDGVITIQYGQGAWIYFDEESGEFKFSFNSSDENEKQFAAKAVIAGEEDPALVEIPSARPVVTGDIDFSKPYVIMAAGQVLTEGEDGNAEFTDYSTRQKNYWILEKAGDGTTTDYAWLKNKETDEYMKIDGEKVGIKITKSGDKWTFATDGFSLVNPTASEIACSVEMDGVAMSEFQLGEVQETLVSAYELKKIFGNSFNINLTTTDDKSLEDNPFSGNLRPATLVKSGNDYTEKVDYNVSSDAFFLQKANGNFIAIQLNKKYSSATADYGFAVVEVSAHDLALALNGDKVGGKEYKYAPLFSIYADESFATGLDKVVNSIVAKEPNGATTYRLGSLNYNANDDKPTLAAESTSAADYPVLDEIKIQLGAFNTVDVKKLLASPAFFTLTNKNTKKTATNYGKVLGLSQNGNVEWVEADEALVGYPETEWAITYDSETKVLTFKNRENPNAPMYYTYDAVAEQTIPVYFTIHESQLYNIDGKTNVFAYQGDTIEFRANTQYKESDGYLRLDAQKLRDQLYYVGVSSSVWDGTAYITENHKDNHQIGLETDQADATKWNLAAAWFTDKNSLGEVVESRPDTILVGSTMTYWDAAHNTFASTDKDGKQTVFLKIMAFSLQNEENGEYMAYRSEDSRYATGKDSKGNEKEEANYFAFKDNGADKYNMVQIGGEEGNRYINYVDYDYNQVCSKVYGGDSADKGILNATGMYKQTENDLFVIEETDAPEYLKLSQGDTIRIFRDEFDSNVLYEKGEFAGINNAVEFSDINPALYVDTAYVNRPGNNRWEYLLAVGVNRIDTTYKCNVPAHGIHRMDTTYGRFLVNLADSAIVEDERDVHVNKYIYEDGSMRYAKLGFVDGMHTSDTLVIASSGDSIEVGTPAPQLVKFAFRVVDHETESFVIETGYKYPEAGNKISEYRGYLAYINGNLVVVDEIEDAEVFRLNADETRTPTANESINAANAAVSVVATDGAVIVKGAEGKNVVVSTILGKVVANEVLNSDNETIAAPAGIVVVSVDGESFKVAVK